MWARQRCNACAGAAQEWKAVASALPPAIPEKGVAKRSLHFEREPDKLGMATVEKKGVTKATKNYIRIGLKFYYNIGVETNDSKSKKIVDIDVQHTTGQEQN